MAIISNIKNLVIYSKSADTKGPQGLRTLTRLEDERVGRTVSAVPPILALPGESLHGKLAEGPC